MIDVSVNWYSIGLQLGVDMSTLDKIRSQHRRDSDRCLTRVIAEWLKNSKCCTWRKVVIAVSSRVGGDNPALARKIAQECKCKPALVDGILIGGRGQETDIRRHTSVVTYVHMSLL